MKIPAWTSLVIQQRGEIKILQNQILIGGFNKVSKLFLLFKN